MANITRDERDRIAEIVEEITPLLDELAELAGKDPYLKGRVVGNLWAERYGHLGEGPMDILAKWLDAEDEDE